MASNDEQHKEHTKNNIIKHLEFNKDSLLVDLAEKQYENLVEALTNNAIDTPSSNPTLSLPQSSTSTFNVGPYNQSDTYRIEEPEFYDKDDDKWNIAD
jgi:hypothetical protein